MKGVRDAGVSSNLGEKAMKQVTDATGINPADEFRKFKRKQKAMKNGTKNI